MFNSRQLRAKSRELNQEGITSIVVVFVLVTLLTLIGIGFTKIMNRSLQSSAANQQATAANYAAQSGVNDVLSYLKTQPTTAATKCDDLIKTGAPLASAAKLSSDGSTAYTCVLVDPNPTSLFYQSLSPYKSQIVKVTTSTQLASLLFSWQSPNRQHNQFIPTAGGQTLYDEKTWSNKNYAPLLRLTLYPIPANGDLSGVQANSKTFFLYPQASGSNTLDYNASGDVSAANCNSKNIGSFVGSADYDCNLVINNLPSASYFYARFAPYYDQAVVKIKGNDSSGQPVKFKNVQSVVDVTAKSGGSTKRLQARIDTSAASGGIDFNISAGSDNVPEFSLGSADTICKRLKVPSSLSDPVTIDAGSAANCQLSLPPPPPPDVTTTAASNITTNSATLNGTVNPNGFNVTDCHFDYGLTSSYGSSVNCSSLPGAGKTGVAVSANISGLAASTNYHFQLSATTAYGTRQGTDIPFNTLRPPASFTFGDNATIPYNTPATLRWSGNNVDWCYATGDWGPGWKYYRQLGDTTSSMSGSQNMGPLIATHTYYLACGQFDQTGTTQSVRITVNPPPPPTVNISASSPITTGQSSAITWKSTGFTTGCTAPSGSSWAAGSRSYPTGSSSTGVLNGAGTYTYSIYCSGPGGNSPTKSATVTVNAPAPPPPPEINKWVWNNGAGNGDSFTYNVSNANTCTIYPDDGGSLTIGPGLNQDFSVTDGHPYVGATIKCWDHNVGPASAHADAGPPPLNISVSNTGVQFDDATGVCGDYVHKWVICPNWSATQGSVSWSQIYCYAAWQGGTKSSWIRDDSNYQGSFVFGFSNVGSPSGYLQVVCKGAYGVTGSTSVYVPPSSYQYNPEAPLPPPPPPTPPPPSPPATCPAGWAGTPPDCYPVIGCFTAGTMIATPSGQRPIEQIKIGDWVITWDPNQGRMVPGQVTHTFMHKSEPTLWLVTSGGSVNTTAIHPFWDGHKWVEAGNLLPGKSYVFGNNGKLQKVLFMMNGSKQDVYNLEIGNANHDYFANGFLVHNKPAGF